MKKTAAVIFGSGVPTRGEEWWNQFNTLVAPRALERAAKDRSLAFVDIDSLVDPGSVQEGAMLARELSHVAGADGRRIAKSLVYKGYELWWMHYDDLFMQFCLPYTQYKRLLECLVQYDSVWLYRPPFMPFFEYFLRAHQCSFRTEGGASKTFPPFSVWLQVALSIPFFLLLLLRRPKVMVWTSDLFDPPRDHDFRFRFIYEALHAKHVPFVEFIRSQERWHTVLSHALRRHRAVIYSHSLTLVSRYFSSLFPDRAAKNWPEPQNIPPLQRFWFAVATHYARTARGDVWSIETMRFIVWCVGVRAGIILAGMSRTFYELLACKLQGIPTVGILHGFASKDYNVYDFMPAYDGEKRMSVDLYGVWSQWWKEYYERYSSAYESKQLVVSGLIRPLQEKYPPPTPPKKPLKVLFVSEQLGIPSETLPYLEALLRAEDISVYLKFRPYRDGFEGWLKKNRPDILMSMDEGKVVRGSMPEAIAQCDVVVGSHATAVVEALLQLKPPVFFESRKWGDYFELKNAPYPLLARNPEEFLALVRKAEHIPPAVLSELRERFFGDPYRNGSAWVVDEVKKLL